jgi:FkbM family methyltransferase
VVLDVGAAIGQFSVFAARLPAARVHAFEPSPANLVTLHRNLELNGIADAVVVHTLALGDRDGEATFSTADNTYLSGLVEPGQEVEHSVTVPVRRLTDVVAELGITRVDVLKLNVAGYEPGVLAGGRSWLEGGGADILVLLIGDESRPWYERCVEWGYRFFFYHPKDRRLFPVAAFDQHSLRHPVWPARHLIGVHEGAIHRGVLDGVAIAESTPSGRP